MAIPFHFPALLWHNQPTALAIQAIPYGAFNLFFSRYSREKVGYLIAARRAFMPGSIKSLTIDNDSAPVCGDSLCKPLPQVPE